MGFWCGGWRRWRGSEEGGKRRLVLSKLGYDGLRREMGLEVYAYVSVAVVSFKDSLKSFALAHSVHSCRRPYGRRPVRSLISLMWNCFSQYDESEAQHQSESALYSSLRSLFVRLSSLTGTRYIFKPRSTSASHGSRARCSSNSRCHVASRFSTWCLKQASRQTHAKRSKHDLHALWHFLGPASAPFLT